MGRRLLPVVKRNVKSLATQGVAKLDRKNWFLPPTFHRSSSITHGLVKLLTFYFTNRDRHLSNQHGPSYMVSDRQGSAAK